MAASVGARCVILGVFYTKSKASTVHARCQNVTRMEMIKSILHYRGTFLFLFFWWSLGLSRTSILGDDGEIKEPDGSQQEAYAGPKNQPEHSMTAEELETFSQSADEALKLYDTDNDGYISFREFALKMIPDKDQHET